jgi:APA family basic amino acid/polyamine antiporter
MAFFRKMPLERLGAARDHRLRRVLGFWQLTALGLGGIIGVGIFVLTGIVAATQAGPAVCISFLIAGVASAAAALCYAEFAGMIPVAGSAYTYSFVVLGEPVAWLMGWALLLEYALIVAAVSIGWAGYLQSLLATLGTAVPAWAAGAPGTGLGHKINLIAVLGTLAVAALLIVRVELGARVNTAMVAVKLAAIVLVIAVGLHHVSPRNWTPFMPFGFSGVAGGAAVVFFAVFGYETLTAAAEESRNPQRDVPLAVIVSLALAMVLYVAMSLILTGIVNYTTLNTAAPVATAFSAIGLPWISVIVSLAAVVGITTTMIAFMLACARIWFAMSRDGLLPAFFTRLHPRYGTPYRPTAVAAVIVAAAAGLLPIGELARLINMGVLSAFLVVCGAIIVLRRRRPDLPRVFHTPWVPVVPLVGMAFSIGLMANLPRITWVAFACWLALGAAIYAAYGRRSSVLAQAVSVEPTDIESHGAK